MPLIEDLLRAEFEHVAQTVQPGQLRPLRVPGAQTVQPGQLRPLRVPAPGRVRRIRLVPLAAGAAVIAVAVVVALLAGPPASHRSVAAPPAAPAAMPRYYVTVTRTSKGLEAVVRDSARGSVTGSALLPGTFAAVGQFVAAAADDRTFVIAANLIGVSTVAGTVAMLYFRLPISAYGRPGTPAELPPGTGNAEPLTGMALSPDGTMLALSLKHLPLAMDSEPSGDIEVINLATGQIRTWTGHGEPGYWPGAPTWRSDRTLSFTWWHLVSPATGTADIAGTRQLDTPGPGGNLLAAALNSFPAAVSGVESAMVTSNGRDIVASSCRDVAASGAGPRLAQARILELSAADGQLLRVLGTQTAAFKDAADDQDALDASCAVLSVDPSGEHLLVQAFSFGRIDAGVFTALPGEAIGYLPAAAW